MIEWFVATPLAWVVVEALNEFAARQIARQKLAAKLGHKVRDSEITICREATDEDLVVKRSAQ